MTFRSVPVLVISLLAALAGCGDSGRATRCKLDTALLDSNSACVEDENCPCGTGCSEGRCVTECRSNGECESNERCDDFGRCVIASADFIAPLTVNETAPSLVAVSTSLLESIDGAEPRKFTVALTDPEADSTFVRIVAEDGLQIDCGAPGTTSADAVSTEPCELTLEDLLEVTVVPTEALAAGNSATVSVFWNKERRAVSYAMPAPGAMSFDPNGAPAGHYKGFATLASVGAGLVPAGAPSPIDMAEVSGGGLEPAGVVVPVEMDIFDDGGALSLRLSDPLGALSPQNQLTASMIDPGDGSLRLMADSILYEDSLISTTSADVGRPVDKMQMRFGWRHSVEPVAGVDTMTSDLVWPIVDDVALAGGVFKAEVPVFFDSLTRPQRAPGAVWSLALTRTSAVADSENAPLAASGQAEIDVNLLRTEPVLYPTRLTDRMTAKFGNIIDQVDTLAGDRDSLAMCSMPHYIQHPDIDTNQQQGNEFARRVALFAMRFIVRQNFGIAPPTTNFIFTNPLIQFRNPTLLGIPGNFSSQTAPDVLNAITRRISFEMTGDDAPSVNTSFAPSYQLNISAEGASDAEGFASLTGRVRVPCQWSFRWLVAAFDHPFGGFFVNLAEDTCDAMAQETGCEIVAASGSNRYQHTGGFVTSGNADARLNREWVFNPGTNQNNATTTVVRMCEMPVVPLACIDTIQCHSGESFDGLNSSLLVDNFFSESGDAVCEKTLRSMGIDADENPQELSAGDMFEACVNELEAISELSPAGEPLASALSGSACLNAQRFFPALETAISRAIESRYPPASATRAEAFDTLALRLFGRWVQVHGYIAREMAEQHALAEVLQLDPVPGRNAPLFASRVLPVSLGGWRLLLHPRFATALDRISGRALAVPDYRPTTFGVEVPLDAALDPAEGLPTTMLDTWRAQVDLTTSMVELARYRADLSVLNFVGQTYRMGVVVDSLAEELTARAVAACTADPGLCAGSTTPPWHTAFLRARGQVDTSLLRLQTAIENLRSGRNPLGIESTDVPLYFADDSQSDSGRFFAISDYLVGSSPEDIGAWAPPLVEDAVRRLEVVRSKWVERQDREVATQRDAQARQSLIINTQVDYGERIINLCGRPGALFPSDVLANWEDAHGRPFNAGNCFIDQSNPVCVGNRGAARGFELITSNEARFAVCTLAEMRELGVDASLLSESANDVAQACEPLNISLANCGAGDRCLSCSTGGEATLESINDLQLRVRPGTDPALLSQVEAVCRANFRGAIVPLPSMVDIIGDIPASCFRGSIGEQAAALRSVRTEIDIARQELQELHDGYDIAIEACSIAKLSGQDLIDAQEDHNKKMTTLRGLKLAADIVATVAESVSDCTSAVAGAGSDAMGQGFAAGSCAAETVQATAESASLGLQFAMDELEADFAVESQEITLKGAYDVCVEEAKQYIVSTTSQGLRIQRAVQDMETAMVAFSNLVVEARMAYDDGLATVDFEVGRRLSPLTQDLWIDEEVTSYQRSFAMAHRVTYLAVVAVEYEYQQSFRLRDQVLGATTPADLESAITELRTLTAARTVRGSRPVARKVVLSLRDDLLDLSDLSDVPQNFHSMSAVERLRNRLTAQSNRVYDDAGNYLGQELNFSISPSRVGFVDPSDQAIFAQDVCSERLWSVNASILGGDDLLFEQDTTFSELTLKKANTFYSQWCGAAQGGQDYQVVSVRPERNLFRDPESPGADFVDAQLSGLTGNTSKALIQPALNVSRTEFEADEFENGASSQLAGRGLYGEYSIFFPVQALSKIQNGSQTPGLDLSKLDDVLIRLDYVGAAQ